MKFFRLIINLLVIKTVASINHLKFCESQDLGTFGRTRFAVVRLAGQRLAAGTFGSADLKK
jgi:hypothetical protein